MYNLSVIYWFNHETQFMLFKPRNKQNHDKNVLKH